MAAGALLAAPAAHGHPFGDPQTVRLEASGTQVTAVWLAPPDDLVLLGGVLGALPERREIVFETDPDGVIKQVTPSDADLLADSAEVATYVEEHITVWQGSQPCRAEVSVRDIVSDGARVVFTCPEPVADVDVEMSLLTDLNPAYRTIAISDGAAEPRRALFTDRETTQTWAFGADADSQGSAIEWDLVRTFDAGPVVPIALLVALIIGAGHGLAPGHGKTLAAAYLLGSGGGRRQAAALATLVAGMHTVSVLALGLLWWVLAGSGTVSVSAATQWGRLAAAIAVLAAGAAITLRRWRRRHHHHHHHLPSGATPWSRAGLIGIASAGGLVPSPSAFLVLISGLLTGEAGLAVAMVVVFGAGLATTILATGWLTVTGRDWFARRAKPHGRGHQWATQLPLVAAAGVLVGGVALTAAAVADLVTV
jgi:ABC-type nickel/cobalt efflux system permease component RcnA